MSDLRPTITRILADWRAGDRAALDRLAPLVYDELRRLAAHFLKSERSDHTLSATDLVHEAYLRLADKSHPNWQDRAHFFAVAAQQMRRVLIDHARRFQAAKRGHGAPRLVLDDFGDEAQMEAAELLALHEALLDLARLDPRKAKAIELRFFAGLTLEETAEVLEVSTATVITDVRLARAFLHQEMSRGGRAGA